MSCVKLKLFLVFFIILAIAAIFPKLLSQPQAYPLQITEMRKRTYPGSDLKIEQTTTFLKALIWQ